MNPIWNIDIEQYEISMIRHDTSSLTIQLWILQRGTICRLDNARLGICHHAIESARLWIGGTTPETFIAGYSRAAVGFGAGGEL